MKMDGFLDFGFMNCVNEWFTLLQPENLAGYFFPHYFLSLL